MRRWVLWYLGRESLAITCSPRSEVVHIIGCCGRLARVSPKCKRLSLDRCANCAHAFEFFPGWLQSILCALCSGRNPGHWHDSSNFHQSSNLLRCTTAERDSLPNGRFLKTMRQSFSLMQVTYTLKFLWVQNGHKNMENWKIFTFSNCPVRARVGSREGHKSVFRHVFGWVIHHNSMRERFCVYLNACLARITAHNQVGQVKRCACGSGNPVSGYLILSSDWTAKENRSTMIKLNLLGFDRLSVADDVNRCRWVICVLGLAVCNSVLQRRHF